MDTAPSPDASLARAADGAACSAVAGVGQKRATADALAVAAEEGVWAVAAAGVADLSASTSRAAGATVTRILLQEDTRLDAIDVADRLTSRAGQGHATPSGANQARPADFAAISAVFGVRQKLTTVEALTVAAGEGVWADAGARVADFSGTTRSAAMTTVMHVLLHVETGIGAIDVAGRLTRTAERGLARPLDAVLAGPADFAAGSTILGARRQVGAPIAVASGRSARAGEAAR